MNTIEPFSQQTEAQACIVIHPGSQFLRIGRPSDSAPHTLLHAIACKMKGNGPVYVDPFLTPVAKLERHTLQEMEECRLKVSHILQSSLSSDGTRRFATPPQQVAAFNKRCMPAVSEDQPPAPALASPTKDIVVGDEILTLKATADYSIHFPYRNGDLNTHPGIGGSLTTVLAHLEAIWGHCITTLLGVPIKDLKFYRAVLVIPDIYNRDHIKKLTNLLLCDLGFGGCFVIQDHVAATFGAGLGGACVVDVGAQKTSVSCVEDAISHTATRLRLDYGGSDVTQVFHWLLRKTGFPCQVNPGNRLDVALLNTLKHDFCHINLNVCGPQEKEFHVVRPSEAPCRYRVQMGDELLIAPLSYFYPELLRITGSKSITTQRPNDGDPEDPLDENFLRETTRMRGREATEALDVGGIEAGEGGEDEIVVDENPLQSSAPLPGSGNAPPSRSESSVATVEKLMSIEQAILTSIDKCPNDELKRKMYNSILVVGGGAKFESFGKWLQNRLSLQIPLAFRSDQVEVTTRPKDLDPTMTVWKGAALMTCLEGSAELWVLRGEWIRQGLKVLREKCPFIW